MPNSQFQGENNRSSQPSYTYMLRCSDGSFYTGWTNNLAARVATHNSGKGGKYTRARLPVDLVYYEEFETKQEAMSREWHIKRLTHSQKCALLENGSKKMDCHEGTERY
jgi:putative endonuclease